MSKFLTYLGLVKRHLCESRFLLHAFEEIHMRLKTNNMLNANPAKPPDCDHTESA